MIVFNFSNVEACNHDTMLLIESLKLFKNKEFSEFYSTMNSDIYHIVENLEFSVEKKRGLIEP